MLPERRKRIAMLLCGLLLLWSSAHFNSKLTSLRGDLGLTATKIPVESMPPELAFTTVALGAFNGLIADFLWMRAMKLQEDAKYFEAVQLADWITKLQPRFTLVWLFQAWNMSYNISVEFPHDPVRGWEDRWLWVQRGLTLLREDGLRYNPADAEMQREMAWIFFNKMGAQTDDANMYYKYKWIKIMEDIFDGTQPDYEDLIGAPKTVAELRQDKEVATYLDQLAETGVNLADDFFLVKHEEIDLSPKAKQLIESPGNQSAYKRVARYARAWRLREKYRTDPVLMQKLDQEFGKLEWRLPEAHGLYWAYKGLERAPKGDTSITSLNNERVLLHALETNFFRGGISIVTDDGLLVTRPNPNLIPKLHALWDDMYKRFPEDKYALKPGHMSFLRTAVETLYLFKQEEEARKYYRILQQRDKQFLDTPTVEAFVVREFYALIEGGCNQREAHNIVRGLLENSFWLLALGEEDQATQTEELAVKVHKKYMDKWIKHPGRHIPGILIMKSDALDACLNNPRWPQVMKDRLALATGRKPKPETEKPAAGKAAAKSGEGA